jgi:hypothetical protein
LQQLPLSQNCKVYPSKKDKHHLALGFELVEEEVQIFFNFLLLSDKRTTTNHFFQSLLFYRVVLIYGKGAH